MTDEGDGIYSFDFANRGIELTGDHGYFCIFAAGTTWSLQTSDLLISPECFGHTASCTGKLVENNVDSEKKSYYVVWDNGVDRSKYAPPLTITSIGNVVGEALPPLTTKLDLLCNFLLYNLDNAREYSGKSDQQLLDEGLSVAPGRLDPGSVADNWAKRGVQVGAQVDVAQVNEKIMGEVQSCRALLEKIANMTNDGTANIIRMQRAVYE